MSSKTSMKPPPPRARDKRRSPETAELMAREPHRVGKPPGRPTATANPVPTRQRVKRARSSGSAR